MNREALIAIIDAAHTLNERLEAIYHSGPIEMTTEVNELLQHAHAANKTALHFLARARRELLAYLPLGERK